LAGITRLDTIELISIERLCSPIAQGGDIMKRNKIIVITICAILALGATLFYFWPRKPRLKAIVKILRLEDTKYHRY